MPSQRGADDGGPGRGRHPPPLFGNDETRPAIARIVALSPLYGRTVFATSSRMSAPFSACSAVVTSGGRSRKTFPNWPAFQTRSPRRKHSCLHETPPSFLGSFLLVLVAD